MNKKIKFSIPAIKCAGCVTAIEKALNDESKVVSVQVDLISKSAIVESELSSAAVIGTIKTAGFDATEMSAE